MSEEPQVGTVYQLKARNIRCGVYIGDGEFIGIRDKFGYRYLDSEYLPERSVAFGTVQSVIRELGTVDKHTVLTRHLGTEDHYTGREIERLTGAYVEPIRYRILSTGEEVGVDDIWPILRENRFMFEQLDNFEQLLGDDNGN